MKLGRALLIFLFVLLSWSRANCQVNEKGLPDGVMHLPPFAEFSCTNLCFGDTTHFINQSLSASTYFWTIYDSTGAIIDTSSAQDISFYFPAPGNYTVELQADNGHITILSKPVVIGNAVYADFSFQICSSVFCNMSGCATNFLWDFGDGATSTLQTPSHQYADTGSYSVKLIAGNGVTSDTLQKSIYVIVTGAPDVSFTWTQSADTIFYHLNNPVVPELVNWYFSDGGTDTAISSYHVFADTGTYNIHLLLRNGCGIYVKDSLVDIVFPLVSVRELSSSAFDVSVFPNPATELLTIKAEGEIKKIELLDLTGRSLISKSVLKCQTQIAMNDLGTGTYFLRVDTGKGIVVRKIIKSINEK